MKMKILVYNKLTTVFFYYYYYLCLITILMFWMHFRFVLVIFFSIT